LKNALKLLTATPSVFPDIIYGVGEPLYHSKVPTFTNTYTTECGQPYYHTAVFTASSAITYVNANEFKVKTKQTSDDGFFPVVYTV